MPGGEARSETSAGGVVFRVDHGPPLYLLIRDSYRNWGFPKGHLEPGDKTDRKQDAELKKAWPDAMAPKTPVKDYAAVLSDVSRIELSVGKLM